MKNLILISMFTMFYIVTAFSQQPGTDTTATVNDTVATQPEPAVKEEPKEKSKFMQKPDKRLKIGLRAGVSSGNFASDPSGYSTSSNIGFNASIYFRVYIVTRLYVQPEVTYYFSSYNFRSTTDGKEDKIKLHSMEIPLLLGLTAVDEKMFRLSIQTGPSIGFHLKVKDNDFDINKSDFNNVYANWIVNAQMRIAKITVFGGFNAGMTNYYGGSRNHTWTVGLGFGM